MAGNITVAIVIILIIGGIIFGCWVDRADTKIADRKNEAASDKQTAGKIKNINTTLFPTTTPCASPRKQSFLGL